VSEWKDLVSPSCVSVVRLPVCIRPSVSVVCVRLCAFGSLSRSRVRLCLRSPVCLSPFDPSTLLSDLREIAINDEAYQRIAEAIRKGESRLPRDLITKQGFRIQLGSCELRDNLVLVNNRLLVPNDSDLRCRILKAYHESFVGGHAGRATTYGRVHVSNNLLVAKCLKLSPGDQPICCLVKEGSKKIYPAQID
jgi:hypothetical protein